VKNEVLNRDVTSKNDKAMHLFKVGIFLRCSSFINNNSLSI